MLEKGFTKVVMILILGTLLMIAGLLNQNLPGRYQYADNAVIDTRTGVVKFAPANIASGVPFDKLPTLTDPATYRQTIQLYQREASRREFEAAAAEAKTR